MEREIEILFRVPLKILEQIVVDIDRKKRFNTAFLFTDEELLGRIDKADSSMAKAEDDFNNRLERGQVSSSQFEQFMLAKADYFTKSRRIKDSIRSRSNPVLSILASN